jgi:type IV pilus secretin PilQ/predicted competence protein
MKKNSKFKIQNSKLHIKIRKLILLFFLFSTLCFAQEEGVISSLKFKEADIKIVIQTIAQKAIKEGKRVNIIIAPEIEGLVTVELSDVHWLTALEAVLKMYDYGYEWVGKDIIMVTTMSKLTEMRKKEAEAAQQEPLEIVTYRLKFLDANDVKKLIEPQLTPRGKVTVLEVEPQKGWKARGGFGGEEEFARAEREPGAKPRTKVLVITDAKSNIKKILKTIEEIDVMPRQVLIEARIMEVSRDLLKDIGFDYATGSTGITGTTEVLRIGREDRTGVGGFISGDVTPSIFDAESSDIRSTIPYTAGLELIFRKYTGAQFEAILHALEEDVHTNTLSAPRLVTLDGQEAYIMVGQKRPIIKSSIQASETSVGISKRLDYYQNLGIELNVVPQICNDEYVNMIIYPSVTSSSQNVDATSQIGDSTTTDSYPIILVRETQTQILMRDGETIAIGGLLKDVKREGIVKVPILGDIPLLGLLFQRKTYDTEKIDLIIFLTVRILKPGEVLPQAFLDTSITSKFEKK